MANRILVYDGGKNIGFEGTATGQVLSWNDSTSAWELTTPSGSGTVTSITAGTGLTGGTITESGTIAADFGTTAGKVAEGDDTRFPPAPAAAGRVIYDTGAAWDALAAGTEGKVLTAHGAAAPTWETPAASGGTVTSITLSTGTTGLLVNTDQTTQTITTSGTFTLTGVLGLANGGTGLNTSTVTAGQLLVGVADGGALALRSVSGDASMTATGAVTVTRIQGSAVSAVAPTAGDVLIWSGTEYVNLPLPSGGSGGGGVIYFFNQATAASGTNLPNNTYQLGRTAQAAYSSITKSSISTGGYDRVGGFVTDAGDPNIATLPTGVWDLNFWATTASTIGNVRARFILYAYDNATDPESGVAIATSSDVEMFDQGGSAQYVASLIIPGGVSLATNKRLYLKMEVRAAVASQSVEFGFGDASPTHTHTTVPSVTGTGIVKVLNSVIVATGQQVNLTTAAAEVTGSLPLANGGTGGTDAPTARSGLGAAASGANSDITSLTGLTTPLSIGQGGTGAATVAANVVFAGPTSGGSAAPSFRSLVAADLPAIPYDFFGEVGGTPDVNLKVFHAQAVRPFILKATGHVAGCDVAPTGGNPSFTIAKNGSPIGTIDYTASSTTGSVTITGGVDVSFALTDLLTVTTPPNLYTMEAPFWTFLATC